MHLSHKEIILMLADNAMILGQRLAEWCGHGPILEQDIAITNIALDLIGEARLYYQYIAEIEDKTEDDYPMQRDVRAFKNVLLVEQPNGNWADTIIRQLIFDTYHYYLLEALTQSNDSRITAIAEKSIKESAYHLSYSGEWSIRLGDGTSESHSKCQEALNKLWRFRDELFLPTPFEAYGQNEGIYPDLQLIKQKSDNKITEIIEMATLHIPSNTYPMIGGKTGVHSEYLGFILSDMQYLQKSYPDVTW